MNLDSDAFSHGQVASKQWLVNELYNCLARNFPHGPEYSYYSSKISDMTVWVLGGWIGILPLLLFTKFDGSDNPGHIRKIRSFDLDGESTRYANLVNNAYEYDEWRFRAFQADANIVFKPNRSSEWGENPDLVINTSTEHFESDEWFHDIPQGTLCAVQSTDMDIEDHISKTHSLRELTGRFPMNVEWVRSKLTFDYPDKKFTRFMKIGVK